jgi:signal transduction histidine kinase
MVASTVRSCDPDIQRIFNGSPHPYLVLCADPEFTIVAVNDQYLAVTGTQRQDLLGRGLFVAFPENPYDRSVSGVSDLRASLERVLRDRAQDIMGVQKYDIPLRDGTGHFEMKYWSPVNTPIFGPSGDVSHILHHVEDVTDFIQLQNRYYQEKDKNIKKVDKRSERMEAEILRRAVEVKEVNRKLKAALEDLEKSNLEMATNTQKLEAARTALEASKNQTDVYMDLLSHDINNMNQIAMGFLEIALESIKLDNSERDLLEKQLSTLNNVSRLIEHISKLRKSGAYGLLNQKYDLCATLSEVINNYSHIPDRDITLNFTPLHPCHIFANDLIRDVFSNLIGNAIKHSEVSVPLIIDVRLERVREEEKEYYLVSVEDNGTGIPDELKGKLFGRFERGQTKASGKGLGLFLVKTLVEDFHGKVWVEDRIKGDHTKGAKFVVMLPVVDNQ